jgi:hypothetical protein
MQKLGYFGIFWGRESIKGDLNSNFIYVKTVMMKINMLFATTFLI